MILGKGQGVVFIILVFQLRTGGPSTAVPVGLGMRPRFCTSDASIPAVLIQGVRAPSRRP